MNSFLDHCFMLVKTGSRPEHMPMVYSHAYVLSGFSFVFEKFKGQDQMYKIPYILEKMVIEAPSKSIGRKYLPEYVQLFYSVVRSVARNEFFETVNSDAIKSVFGLINCFTNDTACLLLKRTMFIIIKELKEAEESDGKSTEYPYKSEVLAYFINNYRMQMFDTKDPIYKNELASFCEIFIDFRPHEIIYFQSYYSAIFNLAFSLGKSKFCTQVSLKLFNNYLIPMKEQLGDYHTFKNLQIEEMKKNGIPVNSEKKETLDFDTIVFLINQAIDSIKPLIKK
uniref:Ufd2P_core domain-containing protein n=1 Tax=Rhabditophanes sp. KR3021 TaxID=114890 RepID=A0AC35U8M3_9BILA